MWQLFAFRGLCFPHSLRSIQDFLTDWLAVWMNDRRQDLLLVFVHHLRFTWPRAQFSHTSVGPPKTQSTYSHFFWPRAALSTWPNKSLTFGAFWAYTYMGLWAHISWDHTHARLTALGPKKKMEYVQQIISKPRESIGLLPYHIATYGIAFSAIIIASSSSSPSLGCENLLTLACAPRRRRNEVLDTLGKGIPNWVQ